MSSAKVLICEVSGDWAALVRRDLSEIVIIETRQIEELWTQLQESPRVVVAIELRSGREPELLTGLRRINREFPQALAVVLAQQHLRNWEDLCREAGAVAFIGPRSVGDLVEIIRFRHRSEAAWTADDEQLPLEDRILANLPWDN